MIFVNLAENMEECKGKRSNKKKNLMMMTLSAGRRMERILLTKIDDSEHS